MKNPLLITAVLAGFAVPFMTLAADSTADRSSESSETVGGYIDDSTITARVKSRFAQDSNVSAMNVKVETSNGVVQLSGFVNSDDERSAAGEIARGVPGVKDVRNDIVVK